jgi:hypothetical protein
VVDLQIQVIRVGEEGLGVKQGEVRSLGRARREVTHCKGLTVFLKLEAAWRNGAVFETPWRRWVEPCRRYRWARDLVVRRSPPPLEEEVEESNRRHLKLLQAGRQKKGNNQR